MNAFFPFALALTTGFSHAFEADHLAAMSSLVTRRRSTWAAIRDGGLWGLGHTSTILLVTGVYLLGRLALHPADFRYLEAGVGALLVGLGAWRLRQASRHRTDNHAHPTPNAAVAYGVGMAHGLAGSGALLLSVLTPVRGSWYSLGYLLVFGLGSVAGMMVAAGLFSLPFSVRLLQSHRLRTLLTGLSAVVCVGLGLKILYENLIA